MSIQSERINRDWHKRQADRKKRIIEAALSVGFQRTLEHNIFTCTDEQLCELLDTFEP